MIKSTKANALFLATVLVSGIIALTYPSILVEAQATREKYVMDPKYNRHEPDHGSDYGMDSYDNKKPYGKDSYGIDSYDEKKSYGNDRSHSTDYGMDSYDNKQSYGNDRSHSTDYGMNSYDERKSYGNDNYKSTEYPSYDKDNSYPSKDNSLILKKGKCNNINVNINGFNGVEVNAVPPALNGLATEAQADEGEVGASSLESGSGSDYRSSGHDSDSRIICINNNEFTVGEDGVTPVDDACNQCFADLQKAAPEVYAAIQDLIDSGIHIDGFDFEGGTVEQFCKALSDFVKESGAPLPVTLGAIRSIIGQLGIDSLEEAEALIDFIECLIKGGLIDINIADVEATLAALPSLAGALK